MWRRIVCTEKQSGNQTPAMNATREVAAARIKAAKGNEEPIGRNIALTTKKTAGTLEEIGNDNDIGLVISGAGFDPCLPLAHIVGCPEICVPVSPTDLQTAEFVEQKEVYHASDGIGAVHSGGA